MEYASTFDQLKFEYLIITAILIHNLFTNFVLSSFHFVNFVNLKKFLGESFRCKRNNATMEEKIQNNNFISSGEAW